jgi:hypothetical protein
MRKIWTLLTCILVGSVYPQKTLAQVRQTPGSTITMEEVNKLPNYLTTALNQQNQSLVLLQLSAAPDHQIFLQSGIVLEDNISGGQYLATVHKPLTLENIQKLQIVGWSLLPSQLKLSPWFAEQNFAAEEVITVLVSVTKGLGPEQLTPWLAAYGAQLTADQPWNAANLWQINIPFEKIDLLATEPFIRYINPKFNAQAVNSQARGFTNAQIATQPLSLGGYNLAGEGVTIGVGDDSDPTHIDYVDRVRSFNPILSSDHGFHTTGTVGGAGLKDERFRGFASKSNLISDYFSQIIANGATYHQDFDMMLTSNSYGNVLGSCSYAGTYDVYAQYVDQQMFSNPQLLHVFAAANDGDMTCSPYPLGYATVTGSYNTAKNALTVGALGKTRQRNASYTSRGPVKDGRLKPEITAVGSYLFSTVFDNNYQWNNGTSMACPNVAGAAVLMYQRYRQLNGGQNPKAGLIKASLMNGASDLATPGPDYSYGFGLLNLAHSLRILDSNRYFSASINTGQEHTYTFTVPSNTAQAKVMLYWNDPAAAPLSAHALINDLDISVTTPAAGTVLPLVLDTVPSQVTAAAVPGIDRINNVEQVTLNNPAAGTYTIKVKGHAVPEANQEYIVVYDFLQQGISMQYPFGGEALVAGDSMIIYWEASESSNNFSVLFSADNGANWTTINNNVASQLRSYEWLIPGGISSSQCLVRVTRNGSGEQAQSKPFVISGRPVAELSPGTEQCPGSIKISWNPVTGASAYRLFRKIGSEMVSVATTAGTSYTFSNLHTDSSYWVAVAAVVGGSTGMRSVAISRTPNDGNCAGVVPGDLAVRKILSPTSGRKLTSTALSSLHSLTVLVGNNDGQVANNYRISYKINNAAWVHQLYSDPINAAGTRQLSLGQVNLSNTGTYTIRVAISNLSQPDPISGNDTLVVSVRHLENPEMNLSGGYEEDFEAVPDLHFTGIPAIGISGADKWDFNPSKPKGRIRSFVNSAIAIDGSRSMSLDNAGNQVFDIEGSSYNTLTGTFNLSNYNTTNWEVRCEFEYLLHGVPKFDTGNFAWVRGSDTDPWLPLAAYQIDTNNLGEVYHTGSLSLTDILAANGQAFSTSTQVRFTQYDTSSIGATYFGNGLTMDNFKLYLVTDDVQLTSIDSVYAYNCGLSDQVPLHLTIANRVNNTVHNIAVYYQLDEGPVHTGIIDSIPGKDTIVYTFAETMNLSANTGFKISAWLYVPTDTYRLNDSVINYNIRNQPVITSFPYLQNFEADEGYFYSDGVNSSWEYGTPNATHINHAASGTRAWKTNLNGNYNRQEISYLYSPCFHIGGLIQPMLSFNLASDIESPGRSVYDIAFAEYSYDGFTWERLGAAGEGTNWYTNDSVQAWTQEGETYWHVATIPLPKDNDIVSFRIALRSDQGAEFEGIAIDDIHVYDLVQPIFNGDQFATPQVRNAGASQQTDFTENNQIAASIFTGSSNLGSVTVQSYGHDRFVNFDSTQYFLPRNFVIQPGNQPGDSVTIRFYIADEGMDRIRRDTICGSCSQIAEVQQLGVTLYEDADNSKENNTLIDNTQGQYTFLGKEHLTWIPYDIGYYADLKVKSFSEFWFNNGGPTRDRPLSANLFDFEAQHQGARQALLNWTSYVNAQTVRYELERANESLRFETIHTVEAFGPDGQSYAYVDEPRITSARVYYRVKYLMQSGEVMYSVIRSLDWSDKEGLMVVYPNPVRNGSLTLEWFKGFGDGIQWSLYTLTGQQVLSNYTETDPFNGKYTFQLSQLGLSPGIYILKVKSGRQTWEFKIVYQ